MNKLVMTVSAVALLSACGSPEPPLQLSDAELCKAYVKHMLDGEQSKFARQVEHSVAKRNLNCKKAITLGM